MVLIYLLLLAFLNLIIWWAVCGTLCQFLGPLPLDAVADSWSLSFFSLLSLISGRVFVWSYYYIDGEPNYRRFLSLVSSFVFSMVLLIFLGRLFGALIGWDGLGVTSFLLVIYFKNRKSLGRGMITALTNRVGDGFLLLLLGLSLLPRDHRSYLFTRLLILTAITKRAQFPFRSWLPAAMAAPTPVRALVHSSTLVTAGIYLLMRFNNFSTEWLIVLGSVTMLMAGFCACAEIDIKKIVALRTLSQLGVIAVGLSLALKNLCFFHLITHAMFKALLFMCVGVGIHTVFGRQDFRSYTVLNSVSPWPSFILTTANLALLGFPFLAGFYRKDRILESFYSWGNRGWSLAGFLLGVGLTTAYRVKLTNLAIVRSANERPACLNGGGLAWIVKAPLLCLAVFSVTGGFLLSTDYRALRPCISQADKLAPLCLISLGVFLGLFVRNLKKRYFRAIWNLTPYYQLRSSQALPIRGSLGVDGGLAEVRGGPGLKGPLQLSSQLIQPAINTGLLVLLCIVL